MAAKRALFREGNETKYVKWGASPFKEEVKVLYKGLERSVEAKLKYWVITINAYYLAIKIGMPGSQ